MGLLDDAIREHLDLKRRRGADPAEVERDEREALGPVRRNPPPGAAEPEGENPEPDGGFAYDQAQEDDWSFEAGDEVSSTRLPEPDDARRSFGYDDAELDDELEPLPEPGSVDDREELGGATAEYDVQAELQRESPDDADEAEDVASDASDAGDEDVLEETPEFLQDTPDHDRLWFEQRPPKDFDFDG